MSLQDKYRPVKVEPNNLNIFTEMTGGPSDVPLAGRGWVPAIPVTSINSPTSILITIASH